MFSKETHGSYSWHSTKSQKAIRIDKITRTLIISRKSYGAWMKRVLRGAKFKLNSQQVHISSLSGFILSALQCLRSSKISLCRSKTVFSAVGWLIGYVDWSPLVPFTNHGQPLYPASVHQILIISPQQNRWETRAQVHPAPSGKRTQRTFLTDWQESTEASLSLKSSTGISI